MALVNVVNMEVLDNPTQFSKPYQFEITFECLQELEDDLEWRVIYVANPKDMAKDVVLDEVLVGPVPVGINKFILEAEAPDHRLIPAGELLGVTVILVTCCYREREFVRVGYYVNHEYIDEEHQRRLQQQQQQQGDQNNNNNGNNDDENQETEQAPLPPITPPTPLDMSKVQRHVLGDKPRVTKFPIPWGDEDENAPPPPEEQDAAMGDGIRASE